MPEVLDEVLLEVVRNLAELVAKFSVAPAIPALPASSAIVSDNIPMDRRMDWAVISFNLNKKKSPPLRRWNNTCQKNSQQVVVVAPASHYFEHHFLPRLQGRERLTILRLRVQGHVIHLYD